MKKTLLLKKSKKRGAKSLLLPEKPQERSSTDHKSWMENFEWLDGQKPNSVVFVGFSSECKLSKEQVHKIANHFFIFEK